MPFQAVSIIISILSNFGCQPKTWRALSDDAISVSGSPGRRPAISSGMGRPVTFVLLQPIDQPCGSRYNQLLLILKCHNHSFLFLDYIIKRTLFLKTNWFNEAHKGDLTFFLCACKHLHLPRHVENLTNRSTHDCLTDSAVISEWLAFNCSAYAWW